MISLEALQSAISNVSVLRQGDVCAPHKVMLLLYILSQYKAGHSHLFNYGLEIHEPLTRLLKEFGPKRRTDYPNMPFWRLRADGFWELRMRKAVNPVEATPAYKKELIDSLGAGDFDEAAYQQLLKHPDDERPVGPADPDGSFPREYSADPRQPTGSGFYRPFKEPRSTLQGYRAPGLPFPMRFLWLRSTVGWCAGWY